ncbi:vWA domain-containing protein [Bacillus salipaludis]|uniref:VWA domain-containing protein n=1 Tax=Bacillus salipaludis TaxID=2547811 RepID=A0ABW8RG09_9BACI
MGLELKYPFLLVLFIPAFFLIYLYFKQIRNSRTLLKVVIGCLRTILFSLLIFALTMPQIVIPIKEESIIFLADRSASFEDMEDGALEWLEESLHAKHGNQSFAIASFADGVMVEQSLSNKKTVVERFNGKLKTGETNLEEGIGFAASMLKTEQGGRIVLLTDGNETAGVSRDAAKLLKNQNIELDYVQLKQKFREDMALTNLEVPPSLYEGEKANIAVSIVSNVEKTADLRISLNNKDILYEKVTVKEGKNEFSFSTIATETGMAIYKAEIATENDTFIEKCSLCCNKCQGSTESACRPRQSGRSIVTNLTIIRVIGGQAGS